MSFFDLFWNDKNFIQKNYNFSKGVKTTFEKLSDVKTKDESFREIKNALIDFYNIQIDNPEDEIGMPVKDVDDLWHAHILNTKEYFNFCENHFKDYLHHNPFTEDKYAKEKEYLADLNLYKILNKNKKKYIDLYKLSKENNKEYQINEDILKSIDNKYSTNFHSENSTGILTTLALFSILDLDRTSASSDTFSGSAASFLDGTHSSTTDTAGNHCDSDGGGGSSCSSCSSSSCSSCSSC